MASGLETEVKICKRAVFEIGEDPDAVSSISSPTTPEEEACALWYATLRDELQQNHRWNFTKAQVKVLRNENERHTLLQTDGGWTVSTIATEYYLPISNTKSFKSKPDDVYANDTALTEGTLGALAVSEWAYGDNDSLGEPTIYVRLADSTDPDTKFTADNDYLEAVYDDPVFGWDYALPYPADTLSLWSLGQDSFDYQNWSNNSGEAINISGIQEPTWEIQNYRLLYFETTAYITYGHKITDPAKFDKWFTDALVLAIAARIAIKLSASRQARNDALIMAEGAIKIAYKNNAAQSNVRREKTLSTRRPTGSWGRAGR